MKIKILLIIFVSFLILAINTNSAAADFDCSYTCTSTVDGSLFIEGDFLF